MKKVNQEIKKDLNAQRFNLTWAESSLKRNGNIFLQWSSWIKEGLETSLVPVPPGKRGD